MDLKMMRNIGISAHIDSGKTTLSERILFYAGRIHRINEVKGGGDGATMDYMDLERERGITITSAATTVDWQDHKINLIDTPGHVDFTVEVERSLRVLDGAILVLCGVGGVQSQSLTVDRQMKRYHVPRLAFINKMDRTGANHERVVQQVREKMGCDAVLMQWPIGKEDNFEGVIDLITMKANYFDGTNGENVRVEEIPAELVDEATEARQHMLEGLSMYSDELMELLLSEEAVSEELIHEIGPRGGADPGSDAGLHGLGLQEQGRAAAAGRHRPLFALAARSSDQGQEMGQSGRAVRAEPDPAKPFVGMAFKIVEDPFGQLTFMRIYQGTIKKGDTHFNQRTSQKQRFSRIVKMHADKREEIDSAGAGDIVAVMGVDCASGDTYAAENKYCTLENMFVPEPVIKMAISPSSREGSDKLGKALARFRKEDPTFRVADRRRNVRDGDRRHGRVALWIFTSSGFAASTASRSKSALPRSATANRRPSRPITTSSTRSRPAVRVNTPISRARSSRCPRIATKTISSSSTTWCRAAFRASTFPAWKRASAIRCSRARWASSRSWASRPRCRTARTTTSTARTWRSRPALATASARHS